MPQEKILTNRTAKVTINGMEYTITDQGEVFGKHGNKITIRPNTDGYASFTAGKKGMRTRVRVHRLVAMNFLPNPNHYSDVDHRDFNRMNASVDNLSWSPHPDNVKRSYACGNHKGRAEGTKNPRAKLDDSLVNQIRIEYWFYSVTIMEISKKYNIPWSTVNNIVKGYTWQHIPMPELTPEVEEMLRINPKFNPRPKE